MIDAVNLPYVGDEIHHLGWNACSSALSPFALFPSPERRYLVVAGLRSSRIYSRWDDQFYPRFRGWMVKLRAHPAGGLALDPGFFVDFGESRPHQIVL